MRLLCLLEEDVGGLNFRTVEDYCMGEISPKAEMISFQELCKASA